MSVRWSAGDAAVRVAVEDWLVGRAAGQVLRDNPRRRIVRLAPPGETPLLVKHFRTGSGRHRLREAWKAHLGRSPARREWAHLRALHAAGVPVPEPLALGRLPDGDGLLVLPFLEGEDWAEGAARSPAARRAACRALGRAVRALHAAGYVHGDLHPGNVRLTAAGPVLLDLQHARRTRRASARLRDLGDLDYGLWGRSSSAERQRVRLAALGLQSGADDPAAVAAVDAAARRRADAHGRSRTRRALRPGRRFARLRVGGRVGLRLRDLPEDAVARALAAHEAALAAAQSPSGTPADSAVWKRDARVRITAVRAGDRPVVVKEALPRGPARALADALRGSSARRGWRAGHGLRARNVPAALPLAFVEQRRAGLPLRSWLVLERLPGPDALEAARAAPEQVLDAALDLLDRLHRRGVDHGDLKATNLVRAADGGFALVDVEQVRFARALDDAARIAALAELNASLPDEVPAKARAQRFRRYARRLPFACGSDEALRQVVAASLARHHRWTGQDCACLRRRG